MLNHNPNPTKSKRTKRCACCKEEKPIAEFSIDRRKKSGLDSYCRACKAEKRKLTPREKQQEYQNRWRANNREQVRAKDRKRYAENPEKGREIQRAYRERHPERVKDSRDRQRQEKRDWIANYKAERGCKSCGIKDHRVLDLHHVNGDDKNMAVSQLSSRATLKAIREEAAKCEVLCANCHRITHYEAR